MQPKSQKPELVFLKKAIKPYSRTIFVGVFIELLMTVFFIIQSYVIADIIGQVASGDFVNASMDKGWFVILAISLFIRPLLSFFKSHLLLKSSYKLSFDIRKQMLDKLADYGNERSRFGQDGAIAIKIVDEPDNLKDFLAFRVGTITSVIVPIMIALVAIFFNTAVGFMLFMCLPVFVLAMVVIGIGTAKKSREQMDAMAQMGGRFMDWLRGGRTLRRLNTHNFAKQDISISSTNYQKHTMSVLKIAFLNTTVLELLSSCMLAVVAIYLGLGLLGKLPWQIDATLSMTVFLLFLTAEFFMPLRRLGMLYHAKSQALGASQFFSQFLDKPTPTSSLQKVDLSQNCEIYFDKVCVKHDERTRLLPTTFLVKTYEKWAIIGQSGLGKSTILQTILQFCQYTGQIHINGVELRLIDPKVLRRQIGYLPQDVSLLPISILDNLNLATTKPIDENRAVALLKQVGIDANDLPQGVHTQLTERGGGLSGGQAKRLSIAQLLLQDCPLWLIDEPTEHLDDDTKREIVALIGAVTTDKTVIWVTHDTPADFVNNVLDLNQIKG